MLRSLSLILLSTSLGALEIEPWLGNIWEFKLTPSFTYSRYSTVQNAKRQLKAPSNDHLIACGFGVSPLPAWSFDVDAEFADTPRQSMGYRSSGYQLRYQWLDDIIGDVVTLTTGLSLRGVSRHSLKDVSCPYHSDFNLEASGAVGKEWASGYEWKVRTFGYGALGMANHGLPWARCLLAIDGNQCDRHRFGVFLQGYFGFGSQEKVDINHFHGYAAIHHQSIDAGACYAYLFEIWGNISLTYTRRLYAHSFPERVNFLSVQYTLPFSFF